MIYRVKKGFDVLLDSLCILMLAAMIGIVFYQVLARRVFASSPVWTGEISRFLMVWAIFLGSAIAFREKGHLCVDFFVNLFPKPVQKALGVLVDILLLAILGVAVWHGFQLTHFVLAQRSPAVAMSMAIPYAAVPTGCVCMMLEILWGMTLGKKQGQMDAEEATEGRDAP